MRNPYDPPGIPEYRVKFYCLLGAGFFLLCAWAMAPDLYAALTTYEFDTLTGRRHHRVREHLRYLETPWAFVYHFVLDLAAFLTTSALGLGLAWRLLRGRKAFKRASSSGFG
jgi:hypothetical protein